MRKLNIATLAVALVLVAGCANLFTGIVTMTDVVKSAMNQYGAAYRAGLSTPAIDAKVDKAHDAYRAACAVAQKALIDYKQSGDPASYTAALAAVKTAAYGIIDIITPLLAETKAASLKADLAKANRL